MKVLVFGAGAVGTYIGGSLALTGHPVTFLERPEAAAQVGKQGLRIQKVARRQARAEVSLESSFTLHPASFDIASSPAEALAHGPFDIAVFALKSYDTQPVLDTLTGLVDSLPPFLCLQNGVDNEPALAALLGADKVIAGTVTSAIGRLAVGDIVLERLRGVGVAGGQRLSRHVVAALNVAGLNALLYPRPADMKWSKLLTNLVANPTSAILDMTPGEIFTHPRLFQMEIAQLRECLAVMAALGVRVVDLPGTPVRALAFAARRLPQALARMLLQKAIGGGRGGKMPSFHIDLHSGRGQTEVDYLNGAVVRYGEKTGVPTPVNRLLRDTLMSLTRGEAPLECYSKNPEALISAL